MNREHAIEVATDTLMKRYKGIRKVLLRADAKAVVNRLVYLEDARIAELTAEAAKYKDALNDIQARVASGYFVDANHLGDIARNAMKDGV